ncbi:MAG: FliH/SctL family protein [Novosphingobium sp.]
MSSLPFAALAECGGFVSDPRFAAALPVPLAEPGDPLAQAWHEGFAAGQAEAAAAARAQTQADDLVRGKLELSFARLDADLAEDLHGKLVETVAALCEAALAPLALDPEALAQRAAVAAAMLARADDERVLRLHPDDLTLIRARLPADLAVAADPALERGALRIDGAQGGIEDGPAHWRRAIAEALAQC